MALRTILAVGYFTAASAECDARSLISKHEGKRSCVYKDTMGIPTVGIGYNLQNGGARQAIAAVGADYDKVLAGTQCLTDSQIMNLFEPSYQSAVRGAEKAVSSYGSLCCNVQEVMTDMDYNLGDSGFASFSTFISLINQGKWADAAADGKGTAWCGQVGSRCTEDMNMIASGCSGPSPSPTPSGSCSSTCITCINNAGGTGCLDRCDSCSSTCKSCFSGGGGMGCADRCSSMHSFLEDAAKETEEIAEIAVAVEHMADSVAV